MLKFAIVVIRATGAVAVLWTQSAGSTSISTEGWTVTVDASQGVLTIGHEKLGTLMKDVRLNVRTPLGWTELHNWSVEKTAPNQLEITTAQPRTVWLVDVGPGALEISCTSTDAALTAALPASIDRMP